MRTVLHVALVAVLALACRKAPPAPEGLDDSARFLLRNFHADDATFGAGLTGLMNWFDEDGGELLDQKANLDNVGAFTLADLDPEDIELLPLVDQERDLGKILGVVSLAEMGCEWTENELLLVRHDQDVVFDKDFDSYERVYSTDRETFEQGRTDLEFAPIDEPIDPFAEGFDAGAFEPSLMLTENDVVSSAAGVTLGFHLVLSFRHGEFDIQGEKTPVLAVLGFVPERFVAEGGDNSMEQNYSIEVNIGRESGDTLRVFSNWSQIKSPWVDSESPLVASTAVNKSQDSAERMTKICEGEIEIADED